MKPILYQIELIGSGFLSIMARPRADEWIDDEFEQIAASGIKQIVSLLETSEAYELGLKHEESYCIKNDMKFLSFPIPDRGIPNSISNFAKFTRMIYQTTAGGMNTVIHCRAGIGRTGLVAAGVLLHAAFAPEETFSHISKIRNVNVPDTDEQYNWLIKNYHSILANKS